jgi:hypothetical protein
MRQPDSNPTEQEAIHEALKRIGDCIRRRRTVLDLSNFSKTGFMITRYRLHLGVILSGATTD